MGRPKDELSVHIIESPKSLDRKERIAEGTALAEALRLHRIGVSLHDVRTVEAFNAAFLDIADWHAKRTRRRVPIIHVSAHGNDEGIRLTSGADLSWDDLARPLRLLARTCGSPILALSSCQGFSAHTMAKKGPEKYQPFQWLVGSTGTPDWSKTLVGFSTLYHQLDCGITPELAVEAMKTASLHKKFRMTRAPSPR